MDAFVIFILPLPPLLMEVSSWKARICSGKNLLSKEHIPSCKNVSILSQGYCHRIVNAKTQTFSFFENTWGRLFKASLA